MRLTYARRSQEDHILPAFNKAELEQAVDLLAAHRGLKAEIEVGDGLHRRQPTEAHSVIQSASATQSKLSTEERLDGFSRSRRASVDILQDGIEFLEPSGPLEIHQTGTQAVMPRR